MRTKTLRVLPNPWGHVHVYADGVPRPCVAVQSDMHEHVAGRYIGATADAVETRPGKTVRVGSKSVTMQSARHELHWTFATEPVELPNTGYYRDRLKEGSLVAADEATARAANVKFREPAEVLAEAKARAVATFDDQHGAGAFASMQPASETPPPASAAQPAPARERKTKD